MKNFFAIITCSIFCAGLINAHSSMAASVSANVIGNLPPVLVESSALDFNGLTRYWSLNDSGDPEIYSIADDGSLARTLEITGVSNRNWEAMAHDAGRNYMFIGDFGNNNCDRTNLRVFRIPYPSNVSANSVAADQISFSFADQSRWPSPWMNFDIEAFVHYHGQLFLFTKADGSAVGYTKMYVLPDAPGTYVAMLVDSFYTNDRTTGAAISPDGTSLVLLSNTRMHLFRNFVGNDFFHGSYTKISISGGWTQKEAITFKNNREVYLTDENTGNGNHLYYIDLSTWIPASPVILSVENPNKTNPASVYPNPANDHLNIVIKDELNNASIAIFDMTGKMTFQSPIENTSYPFVINTAILPTGVYFYRIYGDAKEVQTSRLVVNH